MIKRPAGPRVTTVVLAGSDATDHRQTSDGAHPNRPLMPCRPARFGPCIMPRVGYLAGISAGVLRIADRAPDGPVLSDRPQSALLVAWATPIRGLQERLQLRKRW